MTFYMLSGYSLHAVGLELDAIAAVVIGGTLLAGGVGYVAGTLFGVLILGIIQTLIAFDGTLSSWWTKNRRRSLALALLPVAAAFRGAYAQDSMNRVPSAGSPTASDVEAFTLGTRRRPAGGDPHARWHAAQPYAAGARGKRIPLVLSLPDLPAYLKDTSYIGQLVGRYGNRIAGAAFELDGKRYPLTANNGPNTLHGGDVGFGKYVWQVLGSGGGKNTFVKLGHRSPAGINGFPGNLDVTALISVYDNTLTLA